MSDEVFGDEIGTYTKIYRIGLWTMLIGFIMWLGQFTFEILNISSIVVLAMDVYGLALIFIGGMIALTGYTGYKDEIKHFGMKKIKTATGYAAMLISATSIFIMGHKIYSSLILATIGLILGIISKKKGDNTYGAGSIYIGLIGIVVNIIIIALAYFFQ